MSYTNFTYSELSLGAHEVPSDGTVDISVTVENTGDCAGDEVVQLYLRDPYASMTRPVKELAGFRRIHLEAGEKTRVQFSVPVSFTAFIGRDMQWRVEKGFVEVQIGASSEDIRLSDGFTISDTRNIEGRDRAFRDLITYFSRRSDGHSRGNLKSDLPHGGRDDHT